MRFDDPAPRALTFTDGLGTGLAAAAFAVMLWIAHAGAQLVEMLKEFGGPLHVPWATRIAWSGAWRWGVPCALVAAFAHALLVRRPHHRLAILSLGLAAVALAVLSYVCTWWPLWSVAGRIAP